jgi:hypothetical protein
MKKLLFILPVLLLILSVNSCEDESPEVSTLTLNFKAVYDAEPLMMFSRNYEYEEGMDLQLQLFQFYITDVKLLKEDGSQVAVSDVALISYGDVYDEEDAELGKDFTFDVPAGDYTGISFGFGVEESLNQKTPSDYEVGHPLTENWWGSQTGYIFFKFEANSDLEPNGTFDQPLTLHIGGTDTYNALSFDRDFTLSGGQSTTLPVQVDLHRILVDGSGNFVNFREVKTNHAINSPTAVFLGQNVSSAVTIQ